MQKPIIEDLKGIEKKATITIPAEEVQARYTEELKKIAPRAKIDGFRKGKIPTQVLEKHYGASAIQEALGELMHSNFFKVVDEEKLNIAGYPKYDVTEKYNKGEDFTFSAIFEVFPEIKLQGLEEIEVEKPVVTITDEDVDNMQQILLKQKGSWETSTKPAEKGMRATIDFVGSVDGEEFEGGKADDFALVLGQGNMIPGFEDAIYGKSTGDSFDIEVNFPEDYHVETLKGKPAKFATTIKKMEELILPELTEELIKEFSPYSKNIEEFRVEIKSNMQKELERAILNKLRSQIIEGLLKTNSIDVPSAFIQREISSLKEQTIKRYGQGMASKDFQLPDELFAEQAKRNVTTGMLLSNFIENEKIEVSDELVKERIEKLASSYQDKDQVISYYNSNQKAKDEIKNILLEELAIEKIIEKGKITEKTFSFNEIVNGSR